jgi:hypothetical protein
MLMMKNNILMMENSLNKTSTNASETTNQNAQENNISHKTSKFGADKDPHIAVAV